MIDSLESGDDSNIVVVEIIDKYKAISMLPIWSIWSMLDNKWHLNVSIVYVVHDYYFDFDNLTLILVSIVDNDIDDDDDDDVLLSMVSLSLDLLILQYLMNPFFCVYGCDLKLFKWKKKILGFQFFSLSHTHNKLFIEKWKKNKAKKE